MRDERALEEKEEGTMRTTRKPPIADDGADNSRPLSVAEVERRMRSDGFRTYVRRTHCWWGNEFSRRQWEERRAILYHLYGRGFGWALSQRERKALIRQFVDNEKAVDRMKQLLDCYEGSATFLPCRGDGGNLHSPATQHVLWRKGQEAVLRYESPAGGGGTTIFRVENRVMPYIQVLQRGSALPSCSYIIAATTVANYKVAQSQLLSQGDAAEDVDENAERKVEPVDANRYIHHWFEKDDDVLTRRILHDEGRTSREVLRDIVCTNKNFEAYSLPCALPEIPEICPTFSRFVVDSLLRCGPALVECVDMTTIRKLLKDHEEMDEESDDPNVIRLPTFDITDGEGTLTYREIGKLREFEAIEKVLAGLEKANGGSVHSTLDGTSNASRSGSLRSDEGDDRASQSAASFRGFDDMRRWRYWSSSLHAMVLIGFRRDPTIEDKYWFLLQNSWSDLPLLEVSYAFLAKQMKDGKLVFVMGDISEAAVTSRFGRRREVADACRCLLHGECSYNDDGGDGFVLEEEEDEIE